MNKRERSVTIQYGLSETPVKVSDNFLGEKKDKIVSVASGKGGTGKTLTIINLALSLSRAGKKVLIFDGDLGLSNVDILLGLKSERTLEDVFQQNLNFRDIILNGPQGIRVVPSGSGVLSLQRLSALHKEMIKGEIEELCSEFDVILIDIGAGVHDNVIHLSSLSDQRLIVTTPEPHSLTDAYALIKVLVQEKGITSFDLVVNMAANEQEACLTSDRLIKTGKSFLGADITYLGYIPRDHSVGRHVLHRTISHESRLRTIWGQAWHQVALKLLSRLNHGHDHMCENPETGFWNEALKDSTIGKSIKGKSLYAR